MGVESADDPELASHNESMEQVTLLPSSNDCPLSKRYASSNTPAAGAGEGEGDVRKVKRLRKKKQDGANSPLIKYGSLVLLVGQLVGLVMLMRYSRTTAHTNGQDLYLSSTAVFCMEVSEPINLIRSNA